MLKLLLCLENDKTFVDERKVSFFVKTDTSKTENFNLGI